MIKVILRAVAGVVLVVWLLMSLFGCTAAAVKRKEPSGKECFAVYLRFLQSLQKIETDVCEGTAVATDVKQTVDTKTLIDVFKVVP